MKRVRLSYFGPAGVSLLETVLKPIYCWCSDNMHAVTSLTGQHRLYFLMKLASLTIYVYHVGRQRPASFLKKISQRLPELGHHVFNSIVVPPRSRTFSKC